ncbi:hypothetical protein HanIR_Chr09g0406711 [Helianthus annuus]|nr:hypothetical protein HanIR_Chr09g0406711 [Helianthus annuus]
MLCVCIYIYITDKYVEICSSSSSSCIVLTVVRTKCFSQPALLPPTTPSHLFTYFISMIDAKSRNAGPLVKPCCLLHYFHFCGYLFHHFLHAWQIKLATYQPR